MKKSIAVLAVIVGLILSATVSARAACGRGGVSPHEFRSARVGDSRWLTEHRTFDARGNVHKTWVGDDGYKHQQRRYRSTWDRGTQVRVTYIRLEPGTRYLLESKQWCNYNDYNPTSPPPTTKWTCYDKVFP